MERHTEKTELRFRGKKQRRVYVLTEIALMSAVFCVLAPISMPVPFSPVPVTFGTFVLYLTAVLLGRRKGTMSVVIYLFIGLAGLPVFSGFTAGFTKLLGPGGGYMIGYLPAVFLMGWLTERRTAERSGLQEENAQTKNTQAENRRGFLVRESVAMAGSFACGAFVCYAFGTVWFLFLMNGTYTLSQALLVCVIPFLPFEVIKIILASIAALPAKQKLRRAGIFQAEEYL